MASASSNFISREDYRAQRAIDEGRKAGTIPAALDEEGKEINPHMPQYITQAPWYLHQDHPSLKHQRKETESKSTINTWYTKGTRNNEEITKYRKGACANCGAMTHPTKFCCERPRKKGAKYTGKDFSKDEIIQTLELDYEGKRDRWNGFNPESYKRIVDEWNALNEERQKKQALKLENELKTKDGDDSDSSSDDREDEDKEKPSETVIFTQKDPKVKTFSKTLRIREDQPKYLINLETDSAHYDPKSRAMRQDPRENIDGADSMFKGDNAARFTGDYIKLLQQEDFAKEAHEKANIEINSVAMPSQAALMYKNFMIKKEILARRKKDELLSKYGGQEHLNVPEDILFAQAEPYVEYSREGKIINTAQAKVLKKSKYDEDVFINDHTSVFGSYWDSKYGWGYICCYSYDKHSYCKGEEGKKESLTKEYEEQYQAQQARMAELAALEEEEKNKIEAELQVKNTTQAPPQTPLTNDPLTNDTTKNDSTIEPHSKKQRAESIDSDVSSSSGSSSSSSSSSGSSSSNSSNSSSSDSDSSSGNAKKINMRHKKSRSRSKDTHKRRQSNKVEKQSTHKDNARKSSKEERRNGRRHNSNEKARK